MEAPVFVPAPPLSGQDVRRVPRRILRLNTRHGLLDDFQAYPPAALTAASVRGTHPPEPAPGVASTDDALGPQAGKLLRGNPGQLPEDFIGVLPEVRSRARFEHAAGLREPQR